MSSKFVNASSISASSDLIASTIEAINCCFMDQIENIVDDVLTRYTEILTEKKLLFNYDDTKNVCSTSRGSSCSVHQSNTVSSSGNKFKKRKAQKPRQICVKKKKMENTKTAYAFGYKNEENSEEQKTNKSNNKEKSLPASVLLNNLINEDLSNVVVEKIEENAPSDVKSPEQKTQDK